MPISKTKPKKLLLLTSSGGGGLLQAANAKEQEALAKNPDLEIIRIDVLKEWAPFSRFCIHFWNSAQQSGKIWMQMIAVRYQFLWDIVLFPIIFARSLSIYLKEEIDQIIDTQCLGTAGIVKAVRVYNWLRGKNLRIELILVDLPTKEANHFFRPIRNLSKRNRQLLQVTAIAPLLDEGETGEQFWQKTCRLSETEICYEEAYIRQAFHKYKRKSRPSEPFHIRLRYKNREELALMQSAFQKGPISACASVDEVDFRIAPEDRMATILLGSQPAAEASLNYMKTWSAMAKEYPEITTHLFVFCGDHKEGEQSLFKRMADAVSEIKDFPKNVSIIPFSFQNEHVIAPLFFRSDVTCTRSGGQTAMELMSVSTGEIWIHSEAKKGQDILEGIPGWEAASALYMQKLHKAKIVTPETFTPLARHLYQTSNSQAQSNRALESTA